VKGLGVDYSANDGVLIAFAICIDKLTSRLKLSVEIIEKCFSANVLIEVRLSVVDELNDNLISAQVQTQTTDVGRLNVGSLKEHGFVNVLVSVAYESYRKPPKRLSVTVNNQTRDRQATRLGATQLALTQKPRDILGLRIRLTIARRLTLVYS
jgi:hypothetical protein